MPKPIAYFGYSVDGNTIKFKNLSLNSPTSYTWDFGDGSDSNEKSPIKTYVDEGFYRVTLTVSNSDGDSDPISINVGIGNKQLLGNTIFELIDQYIPSALTGEYTSSEKFSLINKWQLYLQPLTDGDLKVEEEHTHNEFEWHGLINSLIAQLCAYDIVLQGANQFLSAAGNAAGNTTTNTNNSENSSGQEQQIKSIETGPAKTEWYENKDSSSSSETISNIGDAYSSATKIGGAMDKLKESICQQSKRLRIYLPMCGNLNYNTIIPQVTTITKKELHNANPFGITKRMT